MINLTETQQTVINEAIEKFGDERQILKAIEEFSELSQQLCKEIVNETSLADLTSELVAVSIMFNQLFIIFSKKYGNLKFEERVKYWQDYKINMLIDKISD